HGKLFDELNDPVLPRQADCDARLALGDSSMMNELDLVFANRGDAPDPTDEFPLLLITRRSNDFYNSTGRHNPGWGGGVPTIPPTCTPTISNGSASTVATPSGCDRNRAFSRPSPPGIHGYDRAPCP